MCIKADPCSASFYHYRGWPAGIESAGPAGAIAYGGGCLHAVSHARAVGSLEGVLKVHIFFLYSLLYPSAVLLHLPHPSKLLLNVLISSEKSSIPVLLSVTSHSNARLSPWCGVLCSPPPLDYRRVRTPTNTPLLSLSAM